MLISSANKLAYTFKGQAKKLELLNMPFYSSSMMILKITELANQAHFPVRKGYKQPWTTFYCIKTVS